MQNKEKKWEPYHSPDQAPLTYILNNYKCLSSISLGFAHQLTTHQSTKMIFCIVYFSSEVARVIHSSGDHMVNSFFFFILPGKFKLRCVLASANAANQALGLYLFWLIAEPIYGDNSSPFVPSSSFFFFFCGLRRADREIDKYNNRIKGR